MKYLFLVLILAIFSLVFLQHISFDIKEDHFLSSSDFKSINVNFIKEFTKNNSLYRPVPSENLEKVKNHVIKSLETIPNFIVRKQYFTRKIHNKEYNFSNIIANSFTFNKSKPYIILSAHIDGPASQNLTPASIDAITSIGIIIEVTRQIIKQYPNYNLQIVYFDGEEAIDGAWKDDNTLSGSTFFVEQLDTVPHMVFVFDLIGADIVKNKLFAFSSNPKSHSLMSKLSRINHDLYYDDEIIFVDPKKNISHTIIKDDSFPFFKANIPVIDLIPSTFPSTHHTTDDNYQNVNWNYVSIFSNVIYNYLVKNPI
jgi:hypothetical protein